MAKRPKQRDHFKAKVVFGPFGNSKAYAKLVTVDPLTGKEYYEKWLSPQDAEELIKITEA